MTIALNRMDEHVDPVVFYRDIRPFLGGYSGKAFAKTGGLVFEGVSERPFKLTGGTAAQSPSMQTLDILLGIRYPPAAEQFYEDSRKYMPVEQRQYLQYNLHI